MSDAPLRSYLSVDDYLPHPWNKEAVDRLDKWQQGDLIEYGGFTWIGPAGEDTVTGEIQPTDVLPWAPIYAPDLASRYAVVCSQTCDVGGDGPGARHPFVQVAPVVDLSGWDMARQRQVRRFEHAHLVALTGTRLEPGFWVADLRLSVPVSKTFLIGAEPIAGFETEPDRLSFAEALALRLRRPALNSVLSEGLPTSLNRYLKARQKSSPGDTAWCDQVSQVRILVSANRLQLETVTILVVEDVPLGAAHEDVWRSWLRENRKVFADKGLTIDKILFGTLDSYTARLYRDSLPMRLTALATAPTW